MLFLMLCPLLLDAQPNLVLSKPGSNRHFFYQVGDKITLKDKRTDRKVTGYITVLNDSTLEIGKYGRISVSDIATIYRVRPFLKQAAAAGTVVLGVYLPMSILGNVITGQSPILNEDILLVNGTMLVVSGLSRLFVVRRFKIHDPWKLQIMDFGHPVYD